MPLHLSIRETSDAGHPIVVADPDGEHAQAFRNIARRVWAKVSGRRQTPTMPRIVME